MIQLKVYKTKGDTDTALFLDLYETEPIKLTLSIEDITQADATSIFSKTFRVPATRHNNEFFENAYEVDGIDFDVTLKNYAEILVDGAEFREGHIRLQKIFRNQDLDRIDYELLFLGETRDFSSTIAEKTLCQITMTDFDWEGLPNVYTNAADFTGPFVYNDIVTSWAAFPANVSLTAGYADGDILMPLIDHGNTYTDGEPDQGTIALGGSGAGELSFTTQNGSLAQTRMKPMFRAKRVWDQIFEDAGYTYSSEFLNSDRFHQMYISAFGNNEQIGMVIDQVTGTNFESNNPTNGENDVLSFMYNDNVITNTSGYFTVGGSDAAGLGNGSHFTCPADASLGGNFYIMSASAQMLAEIEQSNGPNVSIGSYLELAVVTAPGGTITNTLALGNYSSNGSTSSLTWDSRNGGYQPIAGDTIQVYLKADNTYVDYSWADNTYWDCTAAPGDYYSPLDLDCEHKQIDYVKDILTMFRLVMQPDNNRPNNFIIEPWQEFIGSGTTYDWSHKLVEDQDSVLEPLFNTQSATIEYSLAQDDDFINKFHFDNNKHPYGYLQFNSTNELLKGTRKIEVKGIAPTPIDQIIDTTNNHPEPSFILPSIVEVTGEQTVSNPTRPEQLPIKPKTRLLFYNGRIPITVTSHRWWLNDNNGVEQLQDNYPLVSPYEHWPIQTDSLNLNFSNDTRYYINPSPGTGYFNQGSTLFDEYWSRYISSLYNKFSRRLTAKFILNNVDLQDLTFDDVIFVNGKYYRPEKIIDAQVGAETTVTCQLITLNDQRPIWLDEPLDGFSVAVSNNNCIGEAGNIQITTEGTPPFTWQLSTNGATGTVNPSGSAPFTFVISAPVGVDTLIVTDSLGRVATVQVSVPASTATAVTSTNTQVDATDCSAPCNGEITVTPAGGVPGYTVIWNDGVTGAARTGLCPNTYQYYVEDSNGCQSDVVSVELTCDSAPPPITNSYIVREHLGNCTQLSSATYIVNSTVAIAIGRTVNLLEIGGCFQIMSTSNIEGPYNIEPLSDTYNCATCTDHPHYSWQVESCTTVGSFKYVPIGTPFNLIPGQVIDSVELPGTCWTVIAQQNIPGTDMTFTQVYEDCVTCESASQTYIYDFVSCDGLFSGPIESPVQLSPGSVIDITPGPGCGTTYRTNAGPATYTWTGSLLYETCNSCNGVASQNCHTIDNTAGLSTAQGTYTLNGLGYGWSVTGGNSSSICAEVGSVVTTTGTPTITNSGNACTGPSNCTIQTSTYVIEDCVDQLNWTMDTLGASFQIGDVVQYYQNTSGTGATYCGEIINLQLSGTPDATLANAFASYTCGDIIHCFE
mgnify:CR=1 FL=1